jgi:outer membrane protein assembly factor BamB
LVCLAACSSNDASDEDLQPAELVDFTAEIGFKGLWSANIGRGQGRIYNRLTPVVQGGDIYAAAIDGVVAKLDRFSGKETWVQQLDVDISGGVAVAAGHVLVGSLSGELFSLNDEDGSLNWKTTLSSEIASAASIDSSLVVVRCVDGYIYGLDLSGGEKLWSYNSTIPILTLRGYGEVAFFEQLVIAGLANGKLVALDRRTGAVKWEGRVDIGQGRSEIERIVDIDATPLVIGNVVIGVSYQGRMLAFDAASGRPMWQSNVATYHDLAQGFGNIYAVSIDGHLMAFSRHDGKMHWQQDVLKRRNLSAPMVTSSYIFTSDYEGFLHVFSQVDGRQIGRKFIDREGVRAPVTIAGDIVYVYGDSGRLLALELTKDFKQYRSSGGIPARDEVMRKQGMHPEWEN